MHFEEEKMQEKLPQQNYLYDLQPPHHHVQQSKLNQLTALAKKYYLLEQKFKSQPFFSRMEYYLISKRWIERWKVYVSYKQINTAAPPTKYFGCGKLPTANEDIVCSKKPNSFDFDAPFQHLNVKLKPALQDGKDFEYITKEMHYCLRDCEDYAMINIPREVVETKEGKKIELYFFTINCIILFSQYCRDIEQIRATKFIQVSFQYSHYTTVNNFCEQMLRYLKSYVERTKTLQLSNGMPIKLWLLPFETEKNIWFNTLSQGCKANSTFEYKLYMEGELLEAEKKLNDYDITDTRWMVAQLKESKQKSWMFYNKTHFLEGTCQGCRQTKLLKVFCACKYGAYCSKECKTRDKYSHRGRCPNDAQSEEEDVQLTLTSQSKKSIVGLRNLGNTCFMNSGIQCISHIKEFVHYFVNQKQYLKEINTKNPLGTKGELSTAYAKLLQQLWLGKQNSITPSQLKRAIGKFQPMFSGYSQHDSSELINYLLDGLHEDLNRVIDKPYTEGKDYDGRPDHIIAAQAWELFLKRNQSIIVDSMYGQYKSIVDCPKCQHKSIQFDPFLVCSLPLVNNNKKEIELTFVRQHIQEIKLIFTYDVSSKTTIKEAVEYVRDKMNFSKNARLIAYFASYYQCDSIPSTTLLEDIRKQYTYRNVFVRELFNDEDPQKDFRILLSNVYCNSMYNNENYRRPIISGRLYFFSKNLTYKQVHYRLYSYYKQFYEVANYQSDVIKQEPKNQPFRLLCVPSTHYSPCQYCKKKGCEGCPLQFSDEKFLSDVEIPKKIQIQLYWRKNDKEIIEKMEKMTKEESKAKGVSKGGIKISECFDLFEESETLNEENAWFCPKCKDFVLAKKQMKIYRAPKILILALKRFKRKEYFAEKYNVFVDYPIVDFDMGKYIISPKLPHHALQEKDGEESKPIYDLIGVSNHMGSTGGGHYTAYCKDITTAQWYEYDDSFVSPVKNVQDVVSSSGYVLFYRRKD